MGKLDGRRVVLTGISRGIGLATARRYLEEGAEIVGVSRVKSTLDDAVSALSRLGTITPVLGDVSEKATAEEVRRVVKERWGALDLLVNNAGVGGSGNSFEDEDIDALERTLRINVLGPHYLSRALLPLLRKGNQPRIINVSSGAGRILGGGEVPGSIPSYRLSKLALNGLSALYAASLHEEVSVLALDPGWIRTEMGGPNAHEDPPAAAQRLLDAALMPFETTGVFVHGTDILPWN